MDARRAFENVSSYYKKHAKIGDVYKGFIFSYERLIDSRFSIVQ